MIISISSYLRSLQNNRYDFQPLFGKRARPPPLISGRNKKSSLINQPFHEFLLKISRYLLAVASDFQNVLIFVYDPGVFCTYGRFVV